MRALDPTPISLRYDNKRTTKLATCDGPGCTSTVEPRDVGRPARFCSTACRVRAHRHRRAAEGTVIAETDMGSATSRNRSPERAWLVRLRRGERSVIVAHGLRRSAAERLVEQLSDLLA